MSNQELLARCQQEGTPTIIQITHGMWMTHVLRMGTDATTKELLCGGHQKGGDGGKVDKRQRGREQWRRG